jgi:hypothetical protein
MVECLARIRDDCERKIAPACQRLHLVLEDIAGSVNMLVAS